ncbi:dual specificity protein phosphatase family protein [Chondromyces crocatus]|nr:dual specificity protein phosphatase family protein [Chondromyces crocatus]AKT41252.1 uncharacterized protein CMC5_054190 [Chondromyces crocatus]
MRYGGSFLALSGSLAVLGGASGGSGLLLLWPALSFVVVGAAYVARRPGLLGKRTDGTVAWWAMVLLGPYFLLARGVWRALRLGGKPCADEVSPALWVGRRPFAWELPEGVRVIVDLTAEFPADGAVGRHPGYHCVPTLDGTAPEGEVLVALVERLRGEEGVYLHCAAGHGRSATVAAALLLSRGLATTVDEAEAQLRRRRPGIRLNAAQRRVLEEVVARGRA